MATNISGLVPSYPITSGRCRFLDGQALRYGYSCGGSFRRVIKDGRVPGITFDRTSQTFYLEGFSSGEVTGVLPGGFHNFALEPGTVGVCPETISGSPVSGQAFVLDVYPGRHPSVDLDVPCSGIWGRLNQLKGTAQVGQVSNPPVMKITRMEPQRLPEPDTCWHCGRGPIQWDNGQKAWKCFECQRLQIRGEADHPG